jgi:hypothetical protein
VCHANVYSYNALVTDRQVNPLVMVSNPDEAQIADNKVPFLAIITLGIFNAVY